MSALLLSTGLVACEPTRSVELRADVERYLLHLRRWAPVEAEVGGTIRRILETNFVDEAEVHRQLADGHPRVRRQLGVLEIYEARTDDVRAIHRFYVRAWQDLLRAYDDVETGLRRVDQARLARGREGLLAWRRRMQQTARDLSDLAAVAGVATDAGVARNGSAARATRRDPGGVLLSHTEPVQYHRRWRA